MVIIMSKTVELYYSNSNSFQWLKFSYDTGMLDFVKKPYYIRKENQS